MPLVVTGSVGLDDVETPFGQVKDVLGGSAVYFSMIARLFTRVRMVGVVGEDFPEQHRTMLLRHEIDLAGLETRKGSATFRWSGKYEGSMNDAQTVSVDLNVLAEQAPPIPAAYRDSKYVFLAATHPSLQRSMASEFPDAELIMCDTRDLWLVQEKDELLKLLNSVTGIVLNDGEARLLTDESNLIVAGRRILGYGPQFVIIKKGEHGALLITHKSISAIPGYPTERVKDPTGAGDSFAGGMMGYLANIGTFKLTQLPCAMAYGTVAASFTIEDFSLKSLEHLTRQDFENRLKYFADMLNFQKPV